MMEFFLSKVWMVLVGLVLAGALSAAFLGVQDREEGEMARQCAQSMADLIGRLGEADVGTRCMVDMSSYLRPGTSMELAAGSVWVRWEGGQVAAASPMNLLLPDGPLICGGRDVLVLEVMMLDDRRVVHAQLEKVDASSLTASTNLLASSSVL